MILDHLTPPLGRAGLHGPLQQLEGLLDELVEARQPGAERTVVLEQTVMTSATDELAGSACDGGWEHQPRDAGDLPGSSGDLSL